MFVEENKNDEKLDEKDEPAVEQVAEKVENGTVEKKSKKGIIGIILIVLVIVVLFAFWFLYFKNTKPANNNGTKTKTDNKTYKSELRMSGNDLEDFDLYFMKLENDNTNKVYSPLSIKYALAMLADGSNGETKSQIEAIIGDYVAKSYPNNDHMSFANAMFIRNTFKDSIIPDYTNKLTSKYGAEVIYDSFESPNNINNWVSEKTFHLVNNLVDDVSRNTFFLINALAIDMNWNNQIHCEYTHKIPCMKNGLYEGVYDISYLHEKLDDDSEFFYNVVEHPYIGEEDFYGDDNYDIHEFDGEKYIKGGPVLADFNKYDIIKDLGEDKIREIIKPEYEAWLKTEDGKDDLPLEEGINKFIEELKENYGKRQVSTDFLVYEDDNVKSFAKDLKEYDGKTLQYIGIMPKNVELSEFVKNTDKVEINSIIKALKVVDYDSFEEGYVTRIRGFVPFFKFEYELKLLEDLQELGIKDVFDPEKADLSNMTTAEEAVIDKAIHKANIELSNDGIKASAATAMGGAGAARGPYFEHLFKVPVKDIDVNFNKPYMFIIRDKESGEVWFAGTVYAPIKK